MSKHVLVMQRVHKRLYDEVFDADSADLEVHRVEICGQGVQDLGLFGVEKRDLFGSELLWETEDGVEDDGVEEPELGGNCLGVVDVAGEHLDGPLVVLLLF